VATDAMVRTAAGNHVRVLSGHFSPPQHGVDEPRRQVDPVVATIRAWRGPTVVGADFNVRDGSPEFRREHEVFDAVGLDEATAGAPANSDRVYASAHFAAADARRLATPVGEAPASDHVPVIVDLTLRAGSGPVAHP
jgi:endonuclease/exonuclease/phosphatase family metal-dependent hydrolase